MSKAAMLVAALTMTVLSLCATLPAQSTQETIAPAAVQRDTATPPAAAPVLVEATPTTGQAPTSKPAAKEESKPWILIVMLGGLVLVMVWSSRGRKKEQKKRTEMLSTLKKGDKITTIGGVTGTVTEVSADEVVVKVDESSNTKIRFARWAIRGVGEGSKSEISGQK
jgi:preprotein translocase subunit YajC